MTDNRNQRKRTKTHSDITTRYLKLLNRGLPNPKRPQGLCVMPQGEKFQGKPPRKMTLKIRYGNGAAVVVRARESLAHGEGRQGINQNYLWKGA
jgi:hypothetical protein